VPVSTRSQAPPQRIHVLDAAPQVDCGRFPIKRTPGDRVDVRATILADGHDVLRAVVKHRGPADKRWCEEPMRLIDREEGGDTWAGSFTVQAVGRHRYTIEVWTDHLASWRREIGRKAEAQQDDLSGELSEGAVLLAAARDRAKDKDDRALIDHALGVLEDPATSQAAKVDVALGHALEAACDRWPDRRRATTMRPELEVDVDRELARFGSWYELFPRSWGGFKGVQQVVPQLAELGFDVLYFPPIHPIGLKNRKGRNNTLTAGPDDPGSVYAIGRHGEGGHEAIHPELGTEEDFVELVDVCREHGMEVALDLAIQCSADHPWLEEHPEWFFRRPDGSLKYAENPPKKYQDIYNVDFSCEDWRALWDALRDVVLLWVQRGVKVFRVDNPHTKPLEFWRWMIGEVRDVDPDVVFLSEAFTRWPMMTALGKAGFAQSYTHFTWQTTRWDLERFATQLHGARDVIRGNLFVNTPDILHASLVHGGAPMFAIRLVLATTLGPSWGVYSGFERFENVPLREGSEEYLDSEKYEVHERSLEGAPLLPMIRLLNEARRANPALRYDEGLEFLDTRNDGLIAYTKAKEGNRIIVACCLDAHHAQEGVVHVPWHLDVPDRFQVQDLLDGTRYDWGKGDNFVRLGGTGGTHGQAHVLRVVAP
jgi:starch synthase (maltosyl-transferring)